MKKVINHILFAILFAIVLIVINSCKDDDDKIQPEIVGFELSSPENNSIDISLNVQLEWNDVEIEPAESAEPYYHVQLWEKDSTTYLLDTITGETSLQAGNLDYYSSYQWKVTAYINEIDSIESEIWEFSTLLNVFDGDTTLTTQTAVNEFGAARYNHITGSLFVLCDESDPINDLAPLNNLVQIDGSFRIQNNDALTSIDGFDNITSIGGSVILKSNSTMVSLDGFTRLDSIGTSLSIEYNSALQSISGFDNLKHTGGINFEQNLNLDEVNAFDQLNTVNGDFTFTLNGMNFLNEFNSLEKISGTLKIFNNGLQSLDGFSSLISVGESLEITRNSCLLSLSLNTFHSLETIGLDLEITYCGLSEINCFTSLDSIGRHLTVYSNEFLKSINGFNNLTKVGGDLTINNINLLNISGFSSVEHIDRSLLFLYNNSLHSISGFYELDSIGEDFKVEFNHSLSTIDAFDNLIFVADELHVIRNGNLFDFCWLQSLFESDGLQGSYWFQYNGYDPTIEDILELDCDK